MSTDDNARDALAAFESDRPKHGISELCRLTGMSRPTAWRRLSTMPHMRVGRLVRFSDNQLSAILDSFKREAA